VMKRSKPASNRKREAVRKAGLAGGHSPHRAEFPQVGCKVSVKSSEWLPPPPNPALASESIETGWKARLLVGKRGGVLAVVANALTALRHAPEWQGVLHFNESSLATTVMASPPFQHAPTVPFAWTDEHDVLLAAWLQHQGISVNKEIAGQAAHVIA